MSTVKRGTQWARSRVGIVAAAALMVSVGLLTATLQSQEQDQRKGPGFGLGVKKTPIPWAGKRRTEPVSKNMKLVGWTDMNGRPDGEQVTGSVINGRDYIFLGHYWGQGVSIVDVTDPAKPQTVAYIPCADPFCKSSKVQINGTILMVPMRSTYEVDGDRPILPRHGVMFYDVSDPAHPRQLSYFRTADRDEKLTDGVHYSQYIAPSKYAYISAPVSGYQGLIYMIVDVSDPKNPKEAGRWWAPGQHVGGGEQFVRGVTPTLHGAQSNSDDTLGFFSILGDPPGGLIFLDIKDKAHPKQLSYLRLNPPFINGYFGVHNVVLYESRKILACMNEGVGNAGNRPQMTGWLVDYADPTQPRILSVLPIPPGHEDLTIPARLGPHNAHENQPQGMIDDFMLYISWFHAGIRIFDTSDAKHPQEVGFYEPPDPKARIDARTWNGKPGDPDGSELMSMNHVFVDKRGYVYASGYNDGLYILEYTGPRPDGSKKALDTARQQHEALAAKE